MSTGTVSKLEARSHDSPDETRRPDKATVEVNNLVLIHEATHLLCFNTGLLSRSNDVPLAISEGLACYGETWRPKLKNATFGGPNPGRAQVFAESKAAGLDWIPLDRLVADDALFADAKTQQLAYAESWLWIWNILGNATKRPKLKAALLKVADERTPEGRIDAIVDERRMQAMYNAAVEMKYFTERFRKGN